MIRILTDSASDILPAEAAQLGVDIIPLNVTLEDGILDGGWGERVACYLACTPVRTRTFGIAKGFPDRYDPNELLAQNGMTVENMAAEAVRLLNE